MNANGDSRKPWTRWWWMGSAVNEKELTRHLEAYAKAGIGGVEICPIYGAKGYEDSYVEFLSPRWRELLRHTLKEACRLGIGVDLTLGTGWPYGGPMVSQANAPKRLKIERLVDGSLSASVEGTGQQVKRAAPGGEGNVMCPYSRKALNEYLAAFETLFQEFEERPRCLFYDSFEVFKADWTEGFFEKFKERKGYALEELLEELSGSVQGEGAMRVLCDYRDALFSLLLEDSIKPWAAWAGKREVKVRYQAHGAPGNLLDLYAASDIPETEVFGSNRFGCVPIQDEAIVDVVKSYPLVNKFASSAAHLAGRRLVSSETFTWHREHFKGSLKEMKPEIDRLIVCGINHIFFHGSTFSPEKAQWPGWRFYASTHFDMNDPLWRSLPAMTGYIERCQRVVQEKRMDVPALLYFPYHDMASTPGEALFQCTVHTADKWLEPTPFGKAAIELWTAGIHADYVSDRLLEGSKARDGAIAIAEMRYKTLIVPKCEFMLEKTLEKIEELAKAGASIVFIESMPSSTPGFNNCKSHKETAKSLEALPNIKTINAESILDKLGENGIKPMAKGIETASFIGDDGRRAVFASNLSSESFEGFLSAGLLGEKALVFDPLANAKGWTELDSSNVWLRLEPGQSLFVIEEDAAKLDAEEKWKWLECDEEKELMAVSPWKLEFMDGGPALPEPLELDRPEDWSETPSQACKDFSGTAKYSVRFEWNRTASGQTEAILRVEGLHDAAKIVVNGVDCGSIWSRPFKLDVGKALKNGVNALEIEVTSSGANRIAAADRAGIAWKSFHEINFVDIGYKPFDASKWKSAPSGLSGRVWLSPCRAR